MAVSPEALQVWRDNLFEARLRGVLRVRDYNGESVEYRSDAEMARAIAAADRAIADATTGRRILTVKFQTSKGLNA